MSCDFPRSGLAAAETLISINDSLAPNEQSSALSSAAPSSLAQNTNLTQKNGAEIRAEIRDETTRLTLFIHPVSANAMYRVMGRSIAISQLGREFKKNMADLLARSPHGFITGPVKLTLAFEFMTFRKRDLDNYAKPLIDSLKGVLFVDDSDIYELIMTKRVAAAVDCVRIECEPIYAEG